MARQYRGKLSFNAGEISPYVSSRIDVEKYKNAVEEMLNFYPIDTGPARKRNGSQFVKEVKDSTKTVRLIPFEFSADDTFVLEFGDYYIRFYTEGARIEIGNDPLELETPWAYTELDNLQYTQFGSKMYIVHPSHRPRVLTRKSAIDWELSPFYGYPEPTEELGFTPTGVALTLSATTGAGVTITADAAVFLDGDKGRQIKWTNGNPGRISITAIASSTSATGTVVSDFDTTSITAGFWKMDLSPIADITPNGRKTGSIITIEADIQDSTTAQPTFRAADVGKYILVHNGVVQIVEYTNSSTVKCEVLKALNSKDETGIWTMEEETWNGTRGWPRSVGFFEQRLIFGGTDAEPQSLWLSEVGIYDSFGPGAEDGDAIDIDLVSTKVSRIEWISVGKELVVGTSSHETTIVGGQAGLTPSAISQRARTYYGSLTQQVVNVASEILFIPKAKTQIRTFVYNFDIDGYKAEDITDLASHLFEGDGKTIKEIGYALQPDTIVYAIRDDGVMVSGVFNREQKVIGWSTFETDGEYENIAVISQDGIDQVWVVVKRTINGNTKRYIELFNNGRGDSNLDGFSDSYLTYEGSAADIISGLSHLEGKEVQIKADGIWHPNRTVSSGQITLEFECTEAVIGLPYTSRITTLHDDMNFGIGPMMGQRLRWVEPTLQVYKSAVPTVSGQMRPWRSPTMAMDSALPYFTGYLKYSSVDAPKLEIVDTSPFPVVLLAIYGSAEVDG